MILQRGILIFPCDFPKWGVKLWEQHHGRGFLAHKKYRITYQKKLYVTKILETLFCLVREYSRYNNAVFKQALNSQKNSVIKIKVTWAYNNNVI